jgi:hypothetical protein
MPTREYETVEKAWQSLTDIEIEDDKMNYPVANIWLRGKLLFFNFSVKACIRQVSEWDFAKVLVPWRLNILNYYVNLLSASDSNKSNADKLHNRISALFDGISKSTKPEDVEEKATQIQGLFSDINVVIDFYKMLKKIKVIPFWFRVKDCVRTLRPVDTITLFSWLWLFNFDGVKKNSIYLMNLITQDTNFQLPTVGMESGKKTTMDAAWNDRKMKLMQGFIKSVSKN